MCIRDRPYYVPYSTGVSFALKKRDWILKKIRPTTQLENDQLLGKYHRLRLITDPKADSVRTRLTGNDLRVTVPIHLAANDPKVQLAVKKAAIKVLKKESDQLLPQQLQALASKHGFSYQSVKTKQLKARWGSCSQHQDIVLNVFLMTLPWNLIDYVLLHELVHTEVLSHGPDFWSRLEQVLPNAKNLRRELKGHAPYF
ncbi:MAG: M48 family metallopeptidase, partial [Candidatus Saccharibacteria bacterium]|nr:M48 family metallopeptidase [Candidatus Saccharibacteria bacterium]